MAHVFISYPRENSAEIDRLADDLQARGIDVWLDRKDLLPGQRWQAAIRKAIREGAQFIACFSKAYEQKPRGFIHEELTIAIEELRQRPTDRSWFIPVLIDDASVPDREIGAGATLRDIHWVNLGEDWDDGVSRLARAILHNTGASKEALEAESQAPAVSRELYKSFIDSCLGVHSKCRRKHFIADQQGSSLGGGALIRSLDREIEEQSTEAKRIYDEILFSANGEICRLAQRLYRGTLKSREHGLTALPKAKEKMNEVHRDMISARNLLIEAIRREANLDSLGLDETETSAEPEPQPSSDEEQKLGTLDYYITVEEAVLVFFKQGEKACKVIAEHEEVATAHTADLKKVSGSGLERAKRMRALSREYAGQLSIFSRRLATIAPEHKGAANDIAQGIEPLIAQLRNGAPLKSETREKLQALLKYAKKLGTTYRFIQRKMGSGPSFEKSLDEAYTAAKSKLTELASDTDRVELALERIIYEDI